MSCLPRAVFKSLHRQTLIYLCTQVCTLLTYSLYAISNVLCPLSCVVCMRALYLCMHVSALENHSSLLSSWFFWNRISQSSPELTEKPSLVSQLALGISYPSFWPWDYVCATMPTSVYIDPGDPNSGLHAYMTSALSMRLSPQPSVYLF